MAAIKGMDKLLKKLRGLDEVVEEAVIKGYMRGANDIKTDIQKSIQERSPGKPYVRYSNGKARTGIASRPGDVPNTDRGGFVKSIFFERRKNDVVVGSNDTATEKGVHYPTVFELSPRPEVKRPWLAPAIKDNKENLKKKVRQEIQKALKREGRRK